MIKQYQKHIEDRKRLGIPPLPLCVSQIEGLIDLLTNNPTSEDFAFLLNWLQHNVPVGVDDAAKVKAKFLYQVATSQISIQNLCIQDAIKMLGTMVGGYNVGYLISLLENPTLAGYAAEELKHTILIFESFNKLAHLANQSNKYAQDVIQSYADAQWFLNQEALPKKLTMTVFKVAGETNTDDLSPAQDAWSRSDIPLHALSMLKNPREGINPDEPTVSGPFKQIQKLKEKGYPLVYVGDVVGSGSSRKSATNSMIWHFGYDIPYTPNKRYGGVCLAGKISPIFFNTQQDSGALPIQLDVSNLHMGDVIDIYPYDGKIFKDGKEVTTFQLKSPVLLDEVRAKGRLNLIIGRDLTKKARDFLGLEASKIFCETHTTKPQENQGYTLAQKLLGIACGYPQGTGVLPHTYCEPKITTVGSQDTTGAMTRDEIKDLACLNFQADLVMQSFCHTAAYPKVSDINLQATLPHFITSRGGVSLKVGDGIIHSWLNRLLLPNTVGTGGDSHTRFPIGISFPAGSGLVAFAAATGSMPLDMPESVLVKFSGTLQPAITLRDLVNAIPYYATKQGLLSVSKANKQNIFSGKIIEIHGLDHLSAEQAFELSDATAERSASACVIDLSKKSIIDYLQSNIALIKNMLKNAYENSKTLEKRIQDMETWLKNPQIIKADDNAQYAAIIEINMSDIKEPLLACPNDPDDIKSLSEIENTPIDEVFIGSCMTNIGHFRAAGKILAQAQDIKAKLWLAPPTVMDQNKLKREGYYNIYAKAGARIEIPGCSLCMGNQAQVKAGASVVSTSTRNFPNRLGFNANVFLGSSEIASICAVLGRIPTISEYLQYMQIIQSEYDLIYNYLDFSKEIEIL